MRREATRFFVHVDVANEDDWKRAVDEVVQRYGKLNVLVQFAGLSGTIYQDHYGLRRVGPVHGD